MLPPLMREIPWTCLVAVSRLLFRVCDFFVGCWLKVFTMHADNTENSRIEDYENGVKAMEEKDYDTAIDNFQKCMKKLSKQGLGLTSDLFPQCLQNISSCYSEKDDMDNALSFKKFEKLYYETVLLHNGLQGLVLKESNDEAGEETNRDRGDGSAEASSQKLVTESKTESDDANENQTTKRAAEYEQLAKLCLQQECVSLALEYSGKATLLNRHQYGDDHEKTKNSFKLFTSVYAEAGKQQYSESMEHVNQETDASSITSPAAVEETLLRHRKNIAKGNDHTDVVERPKQLRRTRSILKKKTSSDALFQSNGNQQTPESPRRVTFADPLPQMVRLRDEDENDNSTTNLLLFILICILIILVSFLISAVFCHYNSTMNVCVEFRREITYYYTRLRYLYRSFFR